MPSYKQSGFQCFPRLPAEIRLTIWREALEFESRTQCIQVHPHRNFKFLLPRRETVTRIIWACSESRALADEFYPHILAVYSPSIERRIKSKGCIRINLERVTLVQSVQLCERPLACPTRRTRTLALSKENRKLIHKISLITSLSGQHLIYRPEKPLIKFRNLTSYKILYTMGSGRYFREDALHNFTRHVAGPRVWQPELLQGGRLTERWETINRSYRIHSITFIPSSPRRRIDELKFWCTCEGAIQKFRRSIAAEGSLVAPVPYLRDR